MIRKLIAGVTLTFSICIASTAADERVFYRLNIVNQQNELLIVKIKEQDVWVTIGLYNPSGEFNLSKFTELAADYGLMIGEPELRGDFLVKFPTKEHYSRRIFYRAIAVNEVTKTPDFIEEVKWLPLTEALEQITFPHISHLTKQTEMHPGKVWKATVDRYMEDNQHKIKVIKDFYSQD